MNESDNEGGDETGNAESLYRQYQSRRTSTMSVQRHLDSLSVHATETAAEPRELATAAQTSEKVYLHYQQSRSDTKELAIDRIMQLIDKHAVVVAENASGQSIVTAKQLESQPESLSGPKPRIQSIDAMTGQVFDQAQQDVPAANNARVFKRLVLPAIAAAVLCIVLIPRIFNQSPESQVMPMQVMPMQARVPDLLLENVEQSVVFLNQPAESGFGFSDTGSSQNTAFRYGVVMTEMELLVKSGAGVDAIPYASQIMTISPPLNILADERNSENAAIELISALNIGAGNSILEKELEELQIAIESEVRAQKQFDWYTTGRSVESIRVAAEYSLDVYDIAALQQALSLANELNYPQDIPALVPMLDKLANAQLIPPDEFEQTSQIIDLVENIKVLMQ